MIGIRLQGRLGNQLFQYAFIYCRAKELNTAFYIDKIIVPFYLPEYFELDHGKNAWLDKHVFSIQGFKNIFSYYLKNRYYQNREKKYKLKQESFNDIIGSPREIIKQVSDQAMISGFFQSPLYFKEFEQEIRQKFTVQAKFRKAFEQKFSSLYRDNYVVCVHIRHTDYLQLGHMDLGGADLSLPISYYEKALSNFRHKDVHYVFIGDDQVFIRDKFSYIDNKTIVNDNEIMDFQHLLNADTCITSNSTFSWWGAWLNQRAEKEIYAPKYFMGWRIKQEIPTMIYPDNWVQIEF